MENSKKHSQKVLRLCKVKDRTGLSRSTIYAMMKNRTFPQNIQLGIRSVGWLESDIQGWIESRIQLAKAA